MALPAQLGKAAMAMLAVTSRTVGLVVNAPEIFGRDDFRLWLNDPTRSTATWHKKGDEPGEYSDVFLLVDRNYEGDSSDMPEDAWRLICDTTYGTLCNGDMNMPGLTAHVVVRLTNLGLAG